ncbi:glycoside hydrolase family 127 protein [Granulicella mallensis]|uniref:Glycosyl hydrolase n=1 Tax=Granulicella mallensis (strain ATCC BAA-1857 / DSM 23137 / MP5ACTX8) TaxID=682795 RepID=G8NQX2_GRAMM|nr:beta-L-arabinofuranosidase domain-containing protein [Granulicella mallensis]AEU38435.1 protein of unknown function DUF1680 [Granulicella mallensis MP5ACTX8]
MRKFATPIFFLCSFLQAFPLAHAAAAPQKVQLKAVPLPFSSVRLTGGPLKRAQDLDAQYLLDLQPERMLARLRQRANLAPKAEGYGGWDGDGRQLTGHIAGHYLSAISMMYATTGDVRFKNRADDFVTELQNIQNAQGDGYIGALLDAKGVDGKVRFQDLSKGEIHSGGFDLNGLWSPWYVEHKLFAGLRDAYHLTGNRKALDVEIKFAGWAETIVGHLSDEQLQRMLATEFGGMNEVLADLYADTNDPRWLKLSDKFEHHAIVDPLSRGQDILAGKHANTQIPKMIGELARYVYTGDETDGKAAMFFFDEVSEHHSFATGGDGKNEYFGQPDKMNDMIDGRTAESCAAYNMIKMARDLFSLDPQARYADFIERADLNAILGGQDPEDGRVSYMVPVGRGVQHEYQDKFESFTCCVGSQMETHAFHAYGIYSESGNKLWVSQYDPTTVDWASQGMKLEMVTNLPMGDSAALKITSGKTKVFTIALRRPYWVGAGFSVKVNGETLQNTSTPDTYIEINRKWKVGDTVEIVLPKTLRKEALPDNPNRMAIMWGPLVLAGDLGPEVSRRHSGGQGGVAPEPAPALITAEQNVDGWLKPVAGKDGVFRTANVGLKQNIEFAPFYEMPRRRYAIYWDVFTPTDWANKSAAYQAEEASEKKLTAATIGFAQPGQMQSERDFAEKDEESSPVQLQGRYGRQGNNWFSYDLPVDPASPATLVVTYSNDARGRKGGFDVLVDGTKVGEQSMERRTPEQDIRFFDVKYPLPLNIVKGKQKITVRFQAKEGEAIPGVFGIRTVRVEGAQ